MHLKTRNVNTAFRDLVKVFTDTTTTKQVPIETYDDDGNRISYYEVERPVIVRRPSRNGSVLVIDEPVCVTYTHPRERVLFNAARDANPFFHLYEALWMLAGRNDVAPLAYYAANMREYSDDGETLNGAYGHRWRHARMAWDLDGEGDDARPVFKSGVRPTGTDADGEPTIDQLDVIVNHLKADPHSRRAVLQMWNVEDDLLKIGEPRPTGCCYPGSVDCIGGITRCRKCQQLVPYYGGSKDVCCNLSVMFSLRQGRQLNFCSTFSDPTKLSDIYEWHLDMTVTNRSNDLVWGMLGANYVHFTFLQEYVAARLGAEVGRYHHFTNNLHVYDEPGNPKVAPWKPEAWLADRMPVAITHYHPDVRTVPLVKDPEAFERELPDFVAVFDGTLRYSKGGGWQEPFLRDVAAPALSAFHRYKAMRDPENNVGWGDVSEAIGRIKADDWRITCTGWLKRRRGK